MTSSQSDATRPAHGEVRVAVCTVAPSPKAFAKAVREFFRGATGAAFFERFRRSTGGPGHEDATGIDAMSFAPLALHETGAEHVFDGHGLRLLEVPNFRWPCLGAKSTEWHCRCSTPSFSA